MREQPITTRDILIALGGGVLVVSALFSPQIGSLAKPFVRWADEDRRRLKYYLNRLKKRRLVKIIQRGENYFLHITESGRTVLRRYELDDLKLSTPEKWDKKWRIITFDIPITKNPAREALRTKLRELGFHQLQKSVFVTPHPCQDEVDFICGCFDIEDHVTYIEATVIANAVKLERRFGLI